MAVIAAGAVESLGALQEYPWMMTGTGRAPPVYHVSRPIDVVSLEGWGALWRGMRSGLARDSIFGGVFFSIWQFMHRAMLDWKVVGMDPIPCADEDIGPLHPLAITLLVWPLDFQAQLLQRHPILLTLLNVDSSVLCCRSILPWRESF